jgi:uncharacterized protein YbjT (DUF2867 family)
MRRILLAGATGYLGGFVLRELKGRGQFVRALARSTMATRDFVAPATGVHDLQQFYRDLARNVVAPTVPADRRRNESEETR